MIVRTPGRLVDLVKEHLSVVPIDRCGPLIASGAIAVDGRVGAINDRVGAGAALTVVGPLGEVVVAEERTMVVAFEDDRIVVVDKPGGMHVHPLGEYRTGTLLNAMLWHAGARADQPWAAWRPRPAHRLDRGASGLIAFAKTAEAHDDLRRELLEGTLHRRYRATVEGVISDDEGVIDRPLGRDPTNDYRRAVRADGQLAVTKYRVVERTMTNTIVELELATGRTHQIRAHLASLGHPIVGDVLYGGSSAPEPGIISLRSIFMKVGSHRIGCDGDNSQA